MSWVKLDDRFHSHRKVRKAGLEAVGLHARALSYTAAEDLEGHIEASWVEEAAGKRAAKLTEILVEVGLWEPNGDGWVVHDYLAFNPTNEERARKAAAAKRAAEKRWEERNA